MSEPLITVEDYEVTCAAGVGLDSLRDALREQRSGLIPNDLPLSGLPTFIGKVSALDDVTWPEEEALWQSRNNALIRLALAQGSFLTSVESALDRFGPERVGIVMGSSTSSIDRSEEAYRFQQDHITHPQFFQPAVLNPHAPGLYLAHLLGIAGPNMTINTACSSSAKVFASAARWLRSGAVEAVVVGGADTLCLSVLHGFHSLQLVSRQPCRPFDVRRDGINLGEAAGFALLTLNDNPGHEAIVLEGYGESSDAHHMSHPHPQGAGARLAIDRALGEAGLDPQHIDYINLHGTASRVNDTIEGRLVAELFPGSTCKSSTKGWTGHTLGAAGILESIVAIDALRTGVIPGTLNLEQPDFDTGLELSADNTHREVAHVMSNSFGFGGNNATLIFGRAG